MPIWTIIGLFAATIVSVVSMLIDKGKSKWLKTLLIVFILAGFGIAVVNTMNEQRAKEQLKREKLEAQKNEQIAQQKLDDLKNTIDLTNVTLGNLAILHRLSGNDKYSVCVATSNKKKDLEVYKNKILAMFSGAESSNLVDIKSRIKKDGGEYYELVFGQNLDVAAAEVFQRLAINHHFPPIGDIARICKEE